MQTWVTLCRYKFTVFFTQKIVTLFYMCIVLYYYILLIYVCINTIMYIHIYSWLLGYCLIKSIKEYPYCFIFIRNYKLCELCIWSWWKRSSWKGYHWHWKLEQKVITLYCASRLLKISGDHFVEYLIV